MNRSTIGSLELKRKIPAKTKTLIIGRGVVATIYGWALSNAGFNVTHVVRREGLPTTDTLDVLDLRAGFPKHTRASYVPKTVGQISSCAGFGISASAALRKRPCRNARVFIVTKKTGTKIKT